MTGNRLVCWIAASIGSFGIFVGLVRADPAEQLEFARRTNAIVARLMVFAEGRVEQWKRGHFKHNPYIGEDIWPVFQSETEPRVLAQAVRVCMALKGGDAGDDPFGDVFDFCVWDALRRIVQIGNSDAYTELSLMTQFLRLDGHLSETIHEALDDLKDQKPDWIR